MTRYFPIEEIRELSRKSRLALYGDQSSPIVSDSINCDPGNVGATLESLPTNKKVRSDNRELDSVFGHENQPKISKPYQNALQIIKTQCHGFPFLFRHEVLELSNIKGGATVVQAEKEAIRQGLIVKHTLPRGKTNLCLWEITDIGYEHLRLNRPAWNSKGKYKHKFCVHRIEDQYKKQGYTTKIEACRPNGKLVDLRAIKGEFVLYVEVCASWPIEKELVNIQKDLEGDQLPSEIILAVTDRKMKRPLELAVDDINTKTGLSRPVKVILAGDLIVFVRQVDEGA